MKNQSGKNLSVISQIIMFLLLGIVLLFAGFLFAGILVLGALVAGFFYVRNILREKSSKTDISYSVDGVQKSTEVDKEVVFIDACEIDEDNKF